ncbi:MAG: hypothetical protein HC887_10250 [Desulfobacteraceae bacterium]|nr:hypothetical protein [Desulfobacteraceae bacterium]
MDQDFHYYGTYTAAINSGWGQKKAALVAKAANFVDFLNEATYRGYWELKTETILSEDSMPRDILFKPNFSGFGFSPADGLMGCFPFSAGQLRG